jgi:hypothetical protein
MRTPARGVRSLGVALAAVVALGACGDGSEPRAAAGAPTVTPTPAVDEIPTRAGPLTGRQMPAATALGPGWKERADPGAGHQEETDADAPSTQRRDVAELMEGLVPIGCPEAAVNVALPRPQHALERTYAGPAGQPGVALVLQFADSSAPAGFLDAFERQMRACPPGGTDPNGPVTLGYRAVDRAPDRVSGLRQERGFDADPNRYLVIAVRDGNRVGVVYLSGVPAVKAPAIGADLIEAIRRS